MVGIRRRDMNSYCAYVGSRLPTETEWEYAARGTASRRYPWGSEVSCLYANWAGCMAGLADVGSFPRGATPDGIHDLIGNAQELTSDEYLSGGWDSYPSEVCDPAYPSREIPGLSSNVYRGCAWASFAMDPSEAMARCTGFYREGGYGDSFSSTALGFRCVRSGS